MDVIFCSHRKQHIYQKRSGQGIMYLCTIPNTSHVLVCSLHARHLNDCLKEAIEVPMSLMKTAFGCWEHMETLAAYGNFIAIPDLEVNCWLRKPSVHGIV